MTEGGVSTPAPLFEEEAPRWEQHLPTKGDLTPLNQSLISPILACAFSISETGLPTRDRSEESVERAAQAAFSSLREGIRDPYQAERHPSTRRDYSQAYAAYSGPAYPASASQEQHSSRDRKSAENGPEKFPGILGNMPYPYAARSEGSDGGRSAKKPRTSSEPEGDEQDSEAAREGASEGQARTFKRPRLVWTPQLHKRFVDAVSHLGVEDSVPKTIMQLMNVEGLTRENVASHLQKYRLYLKRMQGGGPADGPQSHSDQLFASGPLPVNVPGGGMPSPYQRNEPSNAPCQGPPSQPYGGHVGAPIGGLISHGNLGAGQGPPFAASQQGYSAFVNQVSYPKSGAQGTPGSGQEPRTSSREYSHHSRDSDPRSASPSRGLSLFPTSSG